MWTWYKMADYYDYSGNHDYDKATWLPYNSTHYYAVYVTNYTFEMYWNDSSEYQCHKRLSQLVPPIMIVLATLGNVLLLLSWLHERMKQHAMGLYLGVLVITNTILLSLGYGLQWISYTSLTPHLANLTDEVCKIWQFAFPGLLSLPGWLTVAVLIDRYLVLWHPLRAVDMSSVFTAKVAISAIGVGLLVVNVHAMWTFKLHVPPYTTQPVCIVDMDRRDFQTVVWPWLAAAFNAYLPMLAVVGFLCALIVGMVCGACLTTGVVPRNGTSLAMDTREVRYTQSALLVAICHVVLELPTIVINLLEYCRPELQQQMRLYGHRYIPPSELAEYYRLWGHFLLAKSFCLHARCVNQANTCFLILLTQRQARQHLVLYMRGKLCCCKCCCCYQPPGVIKDGEMQERVSGKDLIGAQQIEEVSTLL